MTMLTKVPEAIGSTKLAYISDSEKKLLKRREAMMGYPGKKISTEGIPVLADSRADIIAHAKGLGIEAVPDAGVSKKAFKRFTDRLNKVKAAQRTGPAAIGVDQVSRKKFVLSDAQKKASSDFYKTAPGAAYAKQLGKPVGFGIRKEKVPVKVKKDDGITHITPPGDDPTVLAQQEGIDISEAIFDQSKLNQPLLEEIVMIGPRSEVLEERLRNLINTNSGLFKAATTKALQSMNRAGVGNSSMATEAVMLAIMQVAIPIAERDATAFMQQRMANQNATNAFKMQQNEAYYQAFNTKLTGSINQVLRQLSERSANWRAVLEQRGAIGRTAGMSTSAAENALRLVTPGWFS